jgi:hypothetical protein
MIKKMRAILIILLGDDIAEMLTGNLALISFLISN